MRIVISTAVLILLFGIAMATYARQEDRKGQEEHQQNAKSEHQEAKPAQQQVKPVQQQHAQQQAKPQREESKPAEQHTQKQIKPAGRQANQQEEARPAHQQYAQHGTDSQQRQTQAVNQRQAHPAEGNNGNYAHGRISDTHYASSFGDRHSFHVNRGEYDSRRFQYGGYSFGFVDPWPIDWGYSDDVYVVYDDGGYYMYDAVHPGARISINIF